MSPFKMKFQVEFVRIIILIRLSLLVDRFQYLVLIITQSLLPRKYSFISKAENSEQLHAL